MNKGGRGWIPVSKLREMLIEIPGEFMLTGVDSDKLLIFDATASKQRASILTKDEKIVMDKVEA